ncbi:MULTISPECIES: ornithine cyclodeaminase family protein [unclassified Legionella]|uniref:ornithine cyclodeaminase family protein n=1 Tax=unclassified Legionella TaxID=2622702 RepID=UPI00105485FE|nr:MULTISPECIES: ornithine cyclodeaminase family protein [unclassified Legionella]MDI9818365.1 ornithine cyclodeaminase family protein [Legionella sp. PL877]
MSLTLLKLEDIKQSITMVEAIDAMEKAFVQLAARRCVLPLRTPVAVSGEDGLTLTMPAYLPEQKALGLKVVSIFPHNQDKNIPSINGAILLLDAQTGRLEAIMEAAYLTALRTGAVSGLATKYLTSENVRHVAIIGAGVQAFTQLEAVAAVRDIQCVSIWSRNKERAALFAEKVKHQFEVRTHADIHSAVKDADIICTATGSNTPLISLQDVKSTVHINAIGSHTKEMRELSDDVLAKAIVVVDQKEAALSEAGEIIHAIENKALEETSILELGAVIQGDSSSYRDKMTVFKSVGLAIQDISIAQAVYQNAKEGGIGKPFDLG